MENENLLKKLAWSYSTSTGVEFDDLFQEAYIAYHEALKTYNPQKSKFSTYVWHCISSHLRNYVKLEKKHFEPICSIEDANIMNKPALSVSNFFDALSFEARQIAELITNRSKQFAPVTKNDATHKIRQMMIRRGWEEKKIEMGLHNLTLVCS